MTALPVLVADGGNGARAAANSRDRRRVPSFSKRLSLERRRKTGLVAQT